MFKFIDMDAHADENRIFCIDESALLHSSFVFQNHKIGCYVAKVFQMKNATLQIVFGEDCRVCILLFLPDATPCGSFFNRVSHAKPAEKEKPAPQRLTM